MAVTQAGSWAPWVCGGDWIWLRTAGGKYLSWDASRQHVGLTADASRALRLQVVVNGLRVPPGGSFTDVAAGTPITRQLLFGLQPDAAADAPAPASHANTNTNANVSSQWRLLLGVPHARPSTEPLQLVCSSGFPDACVWQLSPQLQRVFAPDAWSTTTTTTSLQPPSQQRPVPTMVYQLDAAPPWSASAPTTDSDAVSCRVHTTAKLVSGMTPVRWWYGATVHLLSLSSRALALSEDAGATGTAGLHRVPSNWIAEPCTGPLWAAVPTSNVPEGGWHTQLVPRTARPVGMRLAWHGYEAVWYTTATWPGAGVLPSSHPFSLLFGTQAQADAEVNERRRLAHAAHVSCQSYLNPRRQEQMALHDARTVRLRLEHQIQQSAELTHVWKQVCVVLATTLVWLTALWVVNRL